MRRMRKYGWVRILDLSTGVVHHAYPDDNHKDHYVTECGLLVTTRDSSLCTKLSGHFKEIDASIQPSCEECIARTSVRPLYDGRPPL